MKILSAAVADGGCWVCEQQQQRWEIQELLKNKLNKYPLRAKSKHLHHTETERDWAIE